MAHLIPSASECIAALVAGALLPIIGNLLRSCLLAFLELPWWRVRRWWIVVRGYLRAIAPRMVARLALLDWIAI